MSRKRELRVTDYLQHFFDAIGRIESYLAGGSQQAFFQSFMTQDAVIRNLEIIGEDRTTCRSFVSTSNLCLPLELRTRNGDRSLPTSRPPDIYETVDGVN
jgi:hypothetical protein